MKTYKKILALLMAVAAVGMMAACGSTAEEPAEAEDAEVVEATTEEAAAPADRSRHGFRITKMKAGGGPC